MKDTSGNTPEEWEAFHNEWTLRISERMGKAILRYRGIENASPPAYVLPGPGGFVLLQNNGRVSK